MNERERWIVYPLLFFTLGTALRDKIGFDRVGIPQDKVFAKEIVLVNDNHEVLASLGGNKPGTAGELKLYHALPDQIPQQRFVIVFDAQGQVVFDPPLYFNILGFQPFRRFIAQPPPAAPPQKQQLPPNQLNEPNSQKRPKIEGSQDAKSGG